MSTSDFVGRRALVVGDAILDRYVWGDVDRISPEAPIPVFRVEHRESRPGGAASVAALLRGLDCEVALAAVVGEDDAGTELRDQLLEIDIDDEALVVDSTRPTTTKERLVGRSGGRHPQQLLRIDNERTDSTAGHVAETLCRALSVRIAAFEPDVVLLSDYVKGVCTAELLSTVFQVCGSRGVPVIVDPGCGVDARAYSGARLLTPNRIEAGGMTGRRIDSVGDARLAASRIRSEACVGAVCVTLDRDGMVYTEGGDTHHLATCAREVYDITGAGDTVLAVVGCGMAAGWDLGRSLSLANVAAGIQVERRGVTVVSRGEIESAVNHRHVLGVTTLHRLTPHVEQLRREGRRIVFTNGCFDLIHRGHVTYLREAAALGDVLVVGVNADASVRRSKGPGRPIVPAQERAEMLAALRFVDHVVVFDEETPHHLLASLQPDVLVKGGDYRTDEVVGRELVLGWGGRVETLGYVEGLSTTSRLDVCAGARPGGVSWE